MKAVEEMVAKHEAELAAKEPSPEIRGSVV